MLLECRPPQPDAVVEAIARLLAEGEPKVSDAWWTDGVAGQGDATARPRSTPGAERA